MDAKVRDSTKESHNIVVAGLRECESRKSVDSLFEHYGIDAIGLRITLLNRAMESPETFYSSGELDEDAKYQREVSMLLTRAWELNDLYEKAGL